MTRFFEAEKKLKVLQLSKSSKPNESEENPSAKLLKPNSDPVNIIIVRPFSRQISTRLANTRVTPNQVTLAALLSAVTASLLVVFSHSLAGAVAAALLIQLYIILDCADGELARLKGMKSDFGKWFDGVTDNVSTGLLIFAFSLRAASALGQIGYVVGFLAEVGFFTAKLSYQYGELVYAKAKAEAARRATAANKKPMAPQRITLFSIARSFSHGVQVLLFALGALLSLHFAVLVIMAVWANVVWVGRVFKYHKTRD